VKETEIILGIDPGLATCGYGLIATKGRRNFEFVDSGTINTSPDTTISNRLKKIHLSTKNLIEEYQPSKIGIERIFFSNNQKTAVLVAQARGVILLASTSKKIFSYSPLEIKKTITGYGQANKQQLQVMVKRLLNLPEIPTPADAADAIGVALCCGLERNSAVHTQWQER